jgi:hypothetical protein
MDDRDAQTARGQPAVEQGPDLMGVDHIRLHRPQQAAQRPDRARPKPHRLVGADDGNPQGLDLRGQLPALLDASDGHPLTEAQPLPRQVEDHPFESADVQLQDQVYDVKRRVRQTWPG